MAFIDFLSALISIAAILLSTIILAPLSLKLLSSKLQGKKYHPVGGTMFNQFLNFNRLHHCATDLASNYKTYRFVSPFRNEIYTSDPANVEHILKTKFDNYGKGWYHYSILGDLLGDGIFTVDGEKWRQQCKVSSYEFSTIGFEGLSAASSSRKRYLDLEMVEFTLDEVLVASISLVMMKSNKRGIHVSNDLQEEILSETLYEDSLRLQQAVADFLWISVIFAPNGG